MFKNILQGYILNQKISKIDDYVIVLKLKKKKSQLKIYIEICPAAPPGGT